MSQATQEKLFYEGYFEALKDDVGALGGSKTVGPWFVPEKEPEQARNWLNDRLNPERRERLTDEQERLIVRRAREARGFSAALAFICDETGFERPKAIAPQDELATLQREFIASVKHLDVVGERIERLTHTPLSAVGQGAKR